MRFYGISIEPEINARTAGRIGQKPTITKTAGLLILRHIGQSALPIIEQSSSKVGSQPSPSNSFVI
jgi:hypothetical protein